MQQENRNTRTGQQMMQTEVLKESQLKSCERKKLFNIKKTKRLSKKKSIDIFNNPIYAGLDNEQINNNNMDNFGPWLRQMQLKNSQKYQNKIKQDQTAYYFKQRLLQYNFQNEEHLTAEQMMVMEDVEMNRQQNPQSDIKPNIGNFYSNRDTIIQINNAQESALPSLMRSKSQIRRLQQVKCASLDMNKYVSLSKKHDLTIIKNSSSKVPRFKHSYSGNLNVITRYFNPKQLMPLLQKKPSNVIYNYCCRDHVQNTNLLNIMKQKNSEEKNIFKQYLSATIQQKFNKTIHKPLNHLQLYHQLKRRRNSNANVQKKLK